MASNPNRGKVVYSVGFFFSFFLLSIFVSLPTMCSTLSQCLLARALACFTNCHGGGKREESQKNPSCTICDFSGEHRYKRNMWEKREKDKSENWAA